MSLLVQLRVSGVLASPRARAADLPAREAAPSGSCSFCPRWITAGSITYRASSGSAGLLQEEGDSAAGLEGHKPLLQRHCSFPRDPCFSCKQDFSLVGSRERSLYRHFRYSPSSMSFEIPEVTPRITSQPLPTAQQDCSATLPFNSPFTSSQGPARIDLCV